MPNTSSSLSAAEAAAASLSASFTPNLTPRDMFVRGSFGGTYWRPITSAVTGKSYASVHLAYPSAWWDGIDEAMLTSPTYDRRRNRYGVEVGSSLSEWETKGWITHHDPYGWVQWYCEYTNGRRLGPATDEGKGTGEGKGKGKGKGTSEGEDQRQIRRWLKFAGPRGRFRRWLVTRILESGRPWHDHSVSPRIRQTLQHWGYVLTARDFRRDLALRRRGSATERAVVAAYDARMRRARGPSTGDR